MDATTLSDLSACDAACPQPARVFAETPAGEVLLCTHHARVHAAALRRYPTSVIGATGGLVDAGWWDALLAAGEGAVQRARRDPHWLQAEPVLYAPRHAGARLDDTPDHRTPWDL